MIKVTEEMLSHILRYGGKCRECGDNGDICAKSGLSCVTNEAKQTIRFVLEAYDHYLAMRAKEAPCPDDVERVAFDAFLAGYAEANGEECIADLENTATYHEAHIGAQRYAAALSSIQGVRTSLGTDGGEL